MKITITGSPKEIAALAMELQERQKSHKRKEISFITPNEKIEFLANAVKSASTRPKNDILFPRERNP